MPHACIKTQTAKFNILSHELFLSQRIFWIYSHKKLLIKPSHIIYTGRKRTYKVVFAQKSSLNIFYRDSRLYVWYEQVIIIQNLISMAKHGGKVYCFMSFFL